MPRHHFFSFMYPNEGKAISQGYQQMSSIMWNAFTTITGINRFFKFTPIDTADQAEAKGQGTEITIDTQNPL